MKSEYEFLDDFILTANVDDKTGKQELVIRHPKSGKKDSISCIHTAIADISLDTAINAQEYEDDHVRLIKARSSENVKEIHLAPEEKFKAFSSWVAGSNSKLF